MNNHSSTAPGLRVLFLINHAGRGGSEKYVFKLIQSYENKRAQCFFAYNEAGLLAEQIKTLGIPMLQMNMSGSFDLKAARTLAQYCKKNKIDVIHAQHPRENYIAILSKLFYSVPRVVYTCHLHWDIPRWHRPINRLLTMHNHKIIAVCNSVADRLVFNGASRKKIQVVFNGVDPPAETHTPSTIRKELGIAEDTFIITTLARYDIMKRYDFLTDAIAKLKSRTDRPFAVLYAGDGELFDDIEKQIHALGLEDVIFQLGFRSDADNILRGSDLFVNSSASEALSFSILEALSHALPVVATNIGGNPDILSAQNDCGILVELENTDAMADALCRFIEDPALYARCSKNALRTIDEVFHFNKISEKTFEIYQ